MTELERQLTEALKRLSAQSETERRRQSEQVEALRQRVERLSAENEALQRRIERLDEQHVGEPECNGVAERFIRTLKEECIHLHDFETLEEARAVIGAFIERYNTGWLLQRHGYLTPARAREKLSRRAA